MDQSGILTSQCQDAVLPGCECEGHIYNSKERFCSKSCLRALEQEKQGCDRGSIPMFMWFRNVWMSVFTVLQGMYVTLLTMFKTYNRRTFTEVYEYPEVPLKVKPRYRGFHRFDLTTCIGCEKCAVACPVDCIYIEKEKSPVGKGFRLNGFTIDYTKCMFCALCVDPCPVDCIFMGSNHDLSCYSRDGCIVDYAKLPLEVAWGKATLNPTVVSESKVLHQPVWVKGEPSPFEFAGAEH